MHCDVLIDCLPYAIGMIVGVATLRLLMYLAQAQFRPAEVCKLLRDERGTVQSLSFVLTVPLFMMILMFIVQLAQVTMARLVVEYAAFAAARSAIVWIPATVEYEPPNCIGRRFYRGEVQRPNGQFSEYEIEMIGRKARRIELAAANACLAISPARRIEDPGLVSASHADALWSGYQAMTLTNNDRASRRNVLSNKAAYALANTRVSLLVHHSVREPPLLQYYVPPRVGEFLPNEIGWRDTLVVTVTHDYALLPGPGRLLADSVSDGDAVASSIVRRGRTYRRRLTATVTMANEGQKAVRSFWQE